MEKLNISVVIHTWNSEELLEKLLASLTEARNVYKYGKTEVIVVDSSKDEAKQKIMESCRKYDAIFTEGPDSVRKKRNMGIDKSQYELIYFVDSDVTVCKELLNIHAETFLNSDDDKIAGSFGYTEFVGRKGFWWHVIQHTTYLDSFGFARMFPYQSWTIGNNVAFYKKTLLEVGKFKEDFPFKLGGDDLEMTYRITKSGYRIKSAPNAVTYHSTETWNHYSAIQNRTKRWGSMEYFIKTINPELFVNCIPKSDVRFALMLILTVIICIATFSLIPLAFWCVWIAIYFLICFFTDKSKKSANPFFYLIGKTFRMNYHIYYMIESIKHKDFSCLYKEMSFSVGQSLFMYKDACFKLWMWLLSFVVSLVGTCVLFSLL